MGRRCANNRQSESWTASLGRLLYGTCTSSWHGSQSVQATGADLLPGLIAASVCGSNAAQCQTSVFHSRAARQAGLVAARQTELD